MRAKIVSFERPGLVLRKRWRRQQFTVAYGEILTAERIASRRALQLHVRTAARLRIDCGGELEAIEEGLRRRGVRIVDGWGAILAPTLEDFEAELAREPARVRQSSDCA